MWDDILKKIQSLSPDNTFDRWFSSVHLIAIDDHSICLGVPNIFIKDWIEEKFQDIIKLAVSEITGNHLNIKLQIAQNPQKNISPRRNTTQELSRPKLNTGPLPATRHKRNPYLDNMNSRYIFENFVVGPSNRFAHAAALAVAESPMKAYNPLFIYGGVGLGKTHLMQAIGHFIGQNNPEFRIVFVTSEKFTNELISAIQNRKTIDFRNKYRNVDILMIDDIHFIAGKESTQEEFHHTFNTLYDAHKQIILSSDRPPKEIPSLEERLVSRFEWGLVTDIQAPDFETRAAIMRKKLEAYPSVTICDDILYFLADHVKANIRELEGVLIKLVSHTTLMKEKITLDVAKKILKDAIPQEEKQVTVEIIQKVVAEHFDIRLYDIKSDKRLKTIVFPRHIAMYLSRTMTTLSLPEIGDYFGGRDHSTVIHACDSIKTKISKDQSIGQLITSIKNKVLN